MPTLPNSITLNKLLQKLTAQDIDIILLEQDFQGVRDSAGPNLHSLRLKLIEFAEKRVKVPRLLELIYDLNSTGYLEIMGVPPPGRSTGSTSSSGQGGNASPGQHRYTSRSNVALIRATHRAGHRSANMNASGKRRLHHGPKPLNTLGNRTIDISLAKSLTGCTEHHNFVRIRLQRRLKPLKVGREH